VFVVVLELVPEREPVEVLLPVDEAVVVRLAEDDGNEDPEDDGDLEALGEPVGRGVVVVVLD